MVETPAGVEVTAGASPDMGSVADSLQSQLTGIYSADDVEALGEIMNLLQTLEKSEAKAEEMTRGIEANTLVIEGEGGLIRKAAVSLFSAFGGGDLRINSQKLANKSRKKHAPPPPPPAMNLVYAEQQAPAVSSIHIHSNTLTSHFVV